MRFISESIALWKPLVNNKLFQYWKLLHIIDCLRYETIRFKLAASINLKKIVMQFACSKLWDQHQPLSRYFTQRAVWDCPQVLCIPNLSNLKNISETSHLSEKSDSNHPLKFYAFGHSSSGRCAPAQWCLSSGSCWCTTTCWSARRQHWTATR